MISIAKKGGVLMKLGFVVALIGIVFFLSSNATEPTVGGDTPVVDNLQVENTIPTIQATENSFGILTPEQKAAREEAARIATEEAARQASSTASTTATSTSDVSEEESTA